MAAVFRYHQEAAFDILPFDEISTEGKRTVGLLEGRGCLARCWCYSTKDTISSGQRDKHNYHHCYQ